MDKINPLQNFDTNETEDKHLQVIFLYNNGFFDNEIAEWTGYTVATVKRYIKKYIDLTDVAKERFERITKNAKKTLRGTKQLVYLYKFYDSDNKLLCSKVGTTTRFPEDRLKEEVVYYKKRDIPVARTEICSVIDCGELPAEGAESITRALFIRDTPSAFCKNDRFVGVDISVRRFNNLVKKYLSGATLKVAPSK